MLRTIQFLIALSLAWVCPEASSQQTVFNVPSADVLERGQLYVELDVPFRHNQASFTPRLVVGLSKNLEAGVNVSSFALPGKSEVTVSPTFKFRLWSRKRLALLIGDNVLLSASAPRFRVGNYGYATLAKEFERGTRVSAGIFHFTKGTVNVSAKAGVQLTFEHPLNSRVNWAADWYSGNHSAGYLTLGTVIKLSKKVTLYPAYMIGNRLKGGNHMALVEVGWRVR